MNAANLKKQADIRSALAHKIHSIKSYGWAEDQEEICRVTEICPYRSSNAFWLKAGGAKIDRDIHTHKIFVRGGEWTISVNNIHGDNEGDQAMVDMYLAFCHDGADFQSLDGHCSDIWHPYLAGRRFHDSLKLTSWRKSFILKNGESKRFTFKIGAFNINVSEWFTKKSGWPFVYVVHSGVNLRGRIKMGFTLTRMVTFTEGEDSRYAMSREEINKVVRSIDIIESQINRNVPGVADTRMDDDAEPTSSAHFNRTPISGGDNQDDGREKVIINR